ncbi:S-4TM family putative pore-forming effector [Streptomyces microflavus]|uniref:S-4TM family putative pore-forming effector n=1 Tax=Streptomyces microflavus TaxID=1919 RepID=UPI0037D98F18
MTGNSVDIAVVQNTERARRFLAAQSTLYSDAKRIHDIRLFTVVSLALLTVVLALAFPGVRMTVGAIGGSTAFLWSVISSEREKRCRREAASVQEEFDTLVFSLPWNSFLADRPSPTVVTEAAARYKGNRTKDWYPDTQNVVRPLDVLICQRSNLGWGASMHRFYAACLTGVLVLLIVLGIGVSLVANFSLAESLTGVLVPLLAPVRELIEMIRANRDSGDSKVKLESKVLAVWDHGVSGSGLASLEDCRVVQDRILAIRQSNSHIPDWLDAFRRNRNERLMQQGADYLIEEAIRNGKVR